MKTYRYESTEESVTNIKGLVVFLAGPTVRGNQQHLTSWRFACIDEFKKQGFDGSLILPEFTDNTESDVGKDWIIRWEFNGLKRADCILFWIPRTRELIGLTTNFELGYWLGREPEKVVLGRPDDAYRINYTDVMWKEDFALRGFSKECPPILNTLENTVKHSILRAELNDEFNK